MYNISNVLIRETLQEGHMCFFSANNFQPFNNFGELSSVADVCSPLHVKAQGKYSIFHVNRHTLQHVFIAAMIIRWSPLVNITKMNSTFHYKKSIGSSQKGIVKKTPRWKTVFLLQTFFAFDNQRYTHLVGKCFRIPIYWRDRLTKERLLFMEDISPNILILKGRRCGWS